MQIWRVENEKGVGCYVGQPTQGLLSRHRNNDTHPTPRFDPEINRRPLKNEISGFATFLQAKKWFSDYELSQLGFVGYKLKSVIVKEITETSEFQVLAIR